MLKACLVAAALAGMFVAPVAAAEAEFEVRDNGQVEFSLPSGNIGCILTPEGGTDVYEPVGGGPEISCDRIEPSYVTVVLGPDDEPEVSTDPGEQGCCGADNVLEYGDSYSFEGFVCYSEKTGLSCETEDEAHGFAMARAGIQTW
jgi:hypothetical protein